MDSPAVWPPGMGTRFLTGVNRQDNGQGWLDRGKGARGLRTEHLHRGRGAPAVGRGDAGGEKTRLPEQSLETKAVPASFIRPGGQLV